MYPVNNSWAALSPAVLQQMQSNAFIWLPKSSVEISGLSESPKLANMRSVDHRMPFKRYYTQDRGVLARAIAELLMEGM